MRPGSLLEPSPLCRCLQGSQREFCRSDRCSYRRVCVTELSQRCRFRLSTAVVMDSIRCELHRTVRKMRQDFSRATPRFTGARAAESVGRGAGADT